MSTSKQLLSASRTQRSINISFNQLASVLTEFIDEFLKGAVSIAVTGESRSGITIDPKYTAILIRDIVRSAGLNKFISLELGIDGDMMTLSLDNIISANDIKKLSPLAKAAGFAQNIESGKIIYTAKLISTELFKLYARSANTLYKNLSIYFFN